MESILLVDDNPLRASMRRSLLEGSGSAIVRAIDAADALCLVESLDKTHDFVLVITGHLQSGISGPEFVAELRSRMPDVPVLVLGVLPAVEPQYREISEVFLSQTKTPEELRILVSRIISTSHRQTA